MHNPFIRQALTNTLVGQCLPLSPPPHKQNLRLPSGSRYDGFMQPKNRGWLILALFFCSGATALVYEVVWSKFLSQMFGSTVYAQTVVLAVFMGGLALGNKLFGGWADRLAQPVRAYGVLEIAIGVYALLFHSLDRIADHVFVALGTPIASKTGLLLALKGILSVALLLGPTILMGGTLPLLAAWLQKSSIDAGRRSARFYSVNSLGAVTGAAFAGFFLVQNFGMICTLQISALVNGVIGLLAILLSRDLKMEPPSSGNALSSAASQKPVLRWAGLIVALSGAVSMGLEVLASRSLVLIFGSSLQSFAIVLMAFILGIGLGSAWIASPKFSGKKTEKTALLLLCIAAGWVTLLVFNIEHWTDFYRITRTGINRNDVGYAYQLLLSTSLSLIVLGIPAACIGAVLPLMIRAISTEDGLLGDKVGTLLTWNTLGAVAGTLVTGFVLMPLLGLRNAFGVLAVILGLAGLAIAMRNSWRIGGAVAVLACGFAASLFIFGNEDWQNVMSSGVFRISETTFNPRYMPIRKEHVKLLYYDDAADATVSVEETDGLTSPAAMGLRINGKPDASTGLDLSTQFMVAHLPMLAKPDATDVFVLGLGSGVTAGAVLPYPVKQIVVAENCQPVVEGAKFFNGWNRGVLQDPRTHLWLEDARTVLKLQPQLYDVIICEPSNPWTVGVGSVFSHEFYTLAASRIKPGGLVCQWFHAYEINDDLLKLVLRTFSATFPYIEVWDVRNDIVILGGKQPWRTGPDVFRKGFSIDRVRADMEMININSPEALMVRQVASQRTAFAIAGEGPIQSDLFPILEYAAPKAFFIGAGTRFLEQFDERTRQQLLAPSEKRKVLSSLPLDRVQYVFTDLETLNGELFGCLSGSPAAANVPCIFHTAQPRPAASPENPILAEATKQFAAGNMPAAAELVKQALQFKPSDVQAQYLQRVFEREKQSRAGTVVEASAN